MEDIEVMEQKRDMGTMETVGTIEQDFPQGIRDADVQARPFGRACFWSDRQETFEK
jgi:hypothetical protein